MSTIVLPIEGPLARADLHALCDRARAALAGSDATVLLCDLGTGVPPDAVTVDALARVQLTAKRLGRGVRLRHASKELQALVGFVGLGSVLQLEAGGEAEEREQGLRVEEERDLDDPAG
jgi:ABC-type transporter Mla MlaB component